MNEPGNEVNQLRDQSSIIGLVNRLFLSTDQRDWADVQSCFAGSVDYDMRSLGAGAPRGPMTVPASEITSLWDREFRLFRATQHLLGNHVVKITDNEASLSCHGMISQYQIHPQGNTRTHHGMYHFRLLKTDSQWRVSSIRFDLKFTGGNLELENVPAD